MAIIVSNTPSSFHAPPINTTLYVNGRKTYYTANMENVEGVLGVPHGGTGNNTFKEGEVVIYSKGKFISAGVTKEELGMLSGLSLGITEDNPKTLVQLLGGKVGEIKTSDGTPLDMDDESAVTLPDYLLKTGGMISGNLQVNGAFAVGNVSIVHDPVTGCITFNPVE